MRINSLIFLLIASFSAHTFSASKPNVLFIAVDDLRPAIGAYGDALAITPNLDALAQKGTLFKNAFASVPTCGASRASLLTSLRPTINRFKVARTRIEEDAPGATTIAQHLKNHGYHTASLGKITHHKDDIVDHWSVPPWGPDNEQYPNYHDPANLKIMNERGGKSYPYEIFEYKDSEHKDGATALEALSRLEQLAKSEQPFFLGVGFARPHLPFSVPKRYWDLYPEEKIVLPNNYFQSRYAPKQAFHRLGELRTYYGVPEKGQLSDDMALQLIRGYYASTSFVDAQIGKIMDKLKALGLYDNTVIVLWGDHGWHLGENKLWHKHSNFRIALNAPLMIAAPGKTGGQITPAMTEFVDIFPTLCDLLSLPKPKQLQGESVARLLDDPTDFKNSVAFSQWKSGTTMFTEKYAYTEWFDHQGKRTANMLFDHSIDAGENVNVADHPENKALVKKLSKMLNDKRLSIK